MFLLFLLTLLKLSLLRGMGVKAMIMQGGGAKLEYAISGRFGMHNDKGRMTVYKIQQ